MLRITLLILFLNVFINSLFSQIKADTSDMLFKGTRINPYNQTYDSTSKITYSAYIDSYYSFYTDSSNSNSFQKFPTISPRNKTFGLNILLFGVKYDAAKLRGVATLFFGDCPNSAWSNNFNFIQEANIGFRLLKKIWLDAGFFRTHIGLESIQPRENMALSIATTTYFEPYFLSGAKLTYYLNDKLILQANIFNSFNQFIETNNNKVLGVSLSYNPNEKSNLTFSSVICDESPTNSMYTQNRSYSNLYYIFKNSRLTFGSEINFGYQENSDLKNATKGAFMYSSLLGIKYRITHNYAPYFRFELYSDPNEILTGPLENENHQLIGLDIFGITTGFEYKPIPNSYLRIESRYLHTKSNERIFFYNNKSTNFRYEFLIGLGVWF